MCYLKVAISFLCVAIAYYFLFRHSLFIGDDIEYTLIGGSGGHRITGFNDVFLSQCHAYLHSNGRFVIHCIVQAFAGVWGLHSFQIASTFVFVALIACILKSSVGRFDKTAFIPPLLLLLIVLHLTFGKCFLNNMACVTNYMWSALFVFAFILLLEHLSQSENKLSLWKKCLLVIFSMVAGSLQESFSIGCGAGVFVWLWINRRRFPRLLWILLGAFCIGVSTIIFSPANFARAKDGVEHVSIFVKLFWNFAELSADIWPFIPLVLMLVWSWFQDRKKTLYFCSSNILFFVFIIVNFLFFLSVAYFGFRQLTGSIICAIILMFRWTEAFYPQIMKGIGKYGSILCFVVLAIGYFPALSARIAAENAYNKMWDSAVNSNDGVIDGTEFINLSYQRRTWLNRRTVITLQEQRFRYDNLSKYLSNGSNEGLLTAVLPASKDIIISECNDANRIGDLIFHPSNKLYYIIKIDQSSLNTYSTIEYSTICSGITWLIQLVKRAGAPSISSVTLRLAELEHFEMEDNSYFILNYREDAPPINTPTIY